MSHSCECCVLANSFARDFCCGWPLSCCCPLERRSPSGLRPSTSPFSCSYVPRCCCLCPSTLVHSATCPPYLLVNLRLPQCPSLGSLPYFGIRHCRSTQTASFSVPSSAHKIGTYSFPSPEWTHVGFWAPCNRTGNAKNFRAYFFISSFLDLSFSISPTLLKL